MKALWAKIVLWFSIHLVRLTPAEQKVTAPWWRCQLMRLAFRLRKRPINAIFWKASRMWASDQTHMALSAFFTGLMMNAISRGEE